MRGRRWRPRGSPCAPATGRLCRGVEGRRRTFVLVAEHRLRPCAGSRALLGQLDGLGDVRELGREVTHLLVRLGAVVVARDEAALEALGVAGRVLGDPLLGGDRVDVAVRRTATLHVRRHRAAVALVAEPEDRVVVLVVVRVDVGVDVDVVSVAARADAGCPAASYHGGHQRRAGVGARAVRAGVGERLGRLASIERKRPTLFS